MKVPNIGKKPWSNIHYMIVGLLDVIAGLATIITLGFYNPTWTMTYLVWITIQQQVKNKNKE